MQKLQDFNPLHEKYGHLPLVVLGIALILVGLFLRTDFFLNIVNFTLEVLGWLGIIGGVAIAAVGIAAFGNERGWWDRIIEANAREGGKMPLFRGLSSSALFVLVLIFFFLPWMSISCFGESVTVSGADLMGVTQSDELAEISGQSSYGIGDALTSEAIFIYFASILALAGAALFFVPGSKGKYIRAGIGAASILCILIYIFLSLASIASELGIGIGEIEDTGIEVSWEIGLWLAVLGYIATAAIQFVPLPFADDAPRGGAQET